MKKPHPPTLKPEEEISKLSETELRKRFEEKKKEFHYIRPWTETEIKLLREYYEYMSVEGIAEVLNRSSSAVEAAIARLKINKAGIAHRRKMS